MSHWLVLGAYLLATLISSILATYVAYARKSPASRAFGFTMVVVALWQLSWALMILVPDPATKFYLANLRTGIAGFVPFGILAFVERFTSDPRPLGVRGYVLLAITPVITALFAITSPFHDLLRRNLSVDGETGLVVSSPGPVFLPFLAVSYAIMLVALLKMVRAALVGAPAQRRLMWFIAGGGTLNILGDLSFHMGLQPLPGLSLGPLMMGFAGISFGTAILRYRAFELDPIVRLGVVDLMDDAMIVVDSNGLFVDLNRAARGLLLADPDTHLGRPSRSVFPEFTRVFDAVEQGASALSEVHATTTAGPRVFDVRISALGPSPRSRGAVLLFHDLTDRIRREEQVRQHAARLEELDRLKDGLLATVSHELRTPLSSILGLTDAVLDEDLSVEVRRYVTNMRASGEMLHALINDLLDLAKAKSGKLTLDEAPFRLDEVVETVVEFFVVACRRKGLALDWYFPSDLPALVGDAHRLRQILMNLVGNSVKYTPSGHVTVKASWRAGELTLEIADTGPGIPAAERERVFDEFTQLDGSSTRRAGGAGLGLAIVRRLVTLMRGSVSVDSNGDRGSLFTVRVPIRADGPSPRDPADSPARTVALLAPRPMRRALLADALRATGERVLEAASFEALLERAHGGVRPSAIWIDAATFDLAWHEALRGEASTLRPVPLVVELDAAENELEAELRARWNPVETIHRPAWTRELADVLHRARRRRARTPSASFAVVPTPPTPPPMVGPRRRLLVVDDSLENQLLVSAYVKTRPYDLVFASDGAAGVAAFRESTFDAVLLDLDMPVMDGHDALRHMRAWEQEQGRPRLPIVAVTAHSGAEFARSAVAEGFTRALFKPTRKKDFLDALDRLFQPGAPAHTPSSVPVLSVVPPAPANEDEDPEIVRLRNDYLRSLAGAPDRLREYLAAGDRESVRRFGHKLFGTAGTFELESLAEVGRSLEVAALRAPDDMPAVIEALASVLEQVARP